MLEAIEKVTHTAHKLISSPDFDEHDPRTTETLGTLMNINHGLLVSLGVSHPRLERIRELVDFGGLGWTKLTGAGGGGCAITLLKPDAAPDRLKELEKKLDTEDFERFETTLGGDGVGVLFPAVLRQEGVEGGFVEIDQEAFLEAEGEDGVERLVGAGGRAKKEGWKFWRVAERKYDDGDD